MNRHLSKAIKWTEKNVGTGMVYLTKNTAWTFLAQIIGIFFGLVVTILLVNLLPKELFGQYRFILTTLPFLALFTLPGVSTALFHFVSQKRNISLSSAVKEKIRWGLLGSLASLVLSAYYLSHGNSELGYSFLLISFFIPFIDTFLIYTSYLKGNKDFRTSAIYESISYAIQATLIVVTVLFTDSVFFLLLSFLVGQISCRFFFYLKTKRKQGTSLEFTPDEKDRLLGYGKKLTEVSLFSIIFNNIDKIIVWHFLGAEAMAIYVVLLILPIQIGQSFGLIGQVLIPKFSLKTKWKVNDYEFLKEKFTIFVLALTALYPIILLISTWIFPIIFPQYYSYLNLLWMSLLIFITLPVRDLLYHFLISQGKHNRMRTSLLISTLSYLVFISFVPLSFMMIIFGLLIKEVSALLIALFYVRNTIRED